MEVWKDVEGWKGLYQVSNFGRVKRVRANSKNVKTLKPYLFCRGYFVVTLSDKAFCEKFYIHRLVALAFIDNHNKEPQVNHKDGDKKNNFWLNLEWISAKENINHSYQLGLAKLGEQRAFSKLTEKEAREIKYSNKLMSNSELGLIYGVSSSTISRIRNCKKWKHI